jgi:hypothetical protein
VSGPTDAARRDYASRELYRLVSEVNAAPRGCCNALYSEGGEFQRLGNWQAGGWITATQVQSATEEITSRQRRARARATIRQGHRNGPARPWLPEGEFRAGRGSQSRGRPAEARREPVRAPVKDRERPPWPELCSLLESSVPVASTPDGREWLESRSISPGAVNFDDTPALLLPETVPCPGWAACGNRPWTVTKHRVLFPLWDPQGWPRSVVARSLRSGGSLKSLSAKGADRKGLVLANREAVGALRDSHRTEWTLIVEGEPDWLTFAAALPRVPVVGVSMGAWRGAFATRLDVDVIVIGTDCNPAGDLMAEQIQQTCGNTVRARVDLLLERRGLSAPEKCPDWNDCLRNGVFGLETAWDALCDSLEVP